MLGDLETSNFGSEIALSIPAMRRTTKDSLLARSSMVFQMSLEETKAEAISNLDESLRRSSKALARLSIINLEG